MHLGELCLRPLLLDQTADRQALAHGMVARRFIRTASRPSREGGGVGFMVERIDWFRAVVPEGMAPDNQDGEVDEFALLPLEEVRAQVAQGRFTLEAGLVIAGFLGL
mgnify:CR=1 FL=1